MRRTETRTCAPIFKSFSLIVPQVASASRVGGEAEAAQGADQEIGKGGKPKPQLIGAHGVGTGAVGLEVELKFLDPVLHVAACAVEVLVKRPVPPGAPA